MRSHQKSRMTFGILLLLIGGILLAFQIVPGFEEAVKTRLSWPLTLVAVGGLLLLIGLLVQNPQMAVPAMILAGIGGILYYQNTSGDWVSWSYAWALIPGFAGLGRVLSGLLGGSRTEAAHGSRMVMISAVLFLILASIFGGLNILGPYWPVLVIAVGALLLIQSLISRD